MMSPYQTYAEKPKEFLALTGYTREEFDALLPHFEAAFLERMRTYRLDGRPRSTRSYSSYQNSPLPQSTDKLFFILVYLKTNNLQMMHAAFFQMTQPQANLWIHCLIPCLAQALTALGEMPARTMDEVAWDTEATLYFHDGVERPIPRPTDPEAQRQYYSGKKKQHTLKNLTLNDAACKIRFLSVTVEGKKHDKKVADEQAYRLPAGSRLLQDTGFQGFSVPEVQIVQPKKKPRGQPLSDVDKHCNQWIGSLRVRAEHTISGVKRYRIVKERIRNWKAGFRDRVLAICCGLHNFRLNFRPWHYPPLQLHLFVNF
jgi:hypothetical protein